MAEPQKNMLLADQGQKMESLGKLAGGVAHDFNNILSIIEGYAKLASKETAQDEPLYDYINSIIEASRRGAALTKTLLTFGRHKTQPTSQCHINAALQDFEVLLTPLLSADINIDYNLIDEPLHVPCDRDILWQIIMNMVTNSRDAMPNGGDIYINLNRVSEDEKIPDLDQKTEYLCLTISDNGAGIPKHIADKIFEPFYTTKTDGQGTGLGLSMAYGAVKQVGGAIALTTKEHEGTSFYIYFPIIHAPIDEVDDIAENDKQYISGRTVLLVEDEKDLLAIMENELKSWGLNVISAINGDQALLAFEQSEKPIDILLTDIVMPEMNGVKLSKLIKSLAPQTRSIFMTGYPANDRRLQDLDIPDDIPTFFKPIEYTKLHKLITQTCQTAQPSA